MHSPGSILPVGPAPTPFSSHSPSGCLRSNLVVFLQHLPHSGTLWKLFPLPWITADAHYSHILYLWVHLHTKIYLWRKNTCSAFSVIGRWAQNSEKFESPNMHIPSWGPRSDTLPCYFSSYCKHVCFSQSVRCRVTHIFELLVDDFPVKNGSQAEGSDANWCSWGLWRKLVC